MKNTEGMKCRIVGISILAGVLTLGHNIWASEKGYRLGVSLDLPLTFIGKGDAGKDIETFPPLAISLGWTKASSELTRKPLTIGIEGRIERTLSVQNSLGLGLGVSSVPRMGIKEEASTSLESWIRSYDLGGYKIPTSLYWRHSKEKWSLLFGGGIDYYQVSVDIDEQANLLFSSPFARGTFKDSGFGYHLQAGTEYESNANWAIGLDLLYQIAKFDNLAGEIETESGKFINKAVMQQSSYGEYIIGIDKNQPLSASQRPFELDMSGFAIKFALRYYF
jgi:hypothetical protein